MTQELQRAVVRPRTGLARWVWLPLAISVAMTGPAWAVVPEVKDGAGFFTPGALTKANQELAQIQKKYRKDLLIETFATVPADKADAVKKMDKQARNRFFETWAVERARGERVEGVYVLITKQPGHVQVEVGKNEQKRGFRVPADSNRLQEIFVKNFQNKEYDSGLLEGIRFVDEKLGENLGVATPRASEPLPQIIEHGVHKVDPAAQGVSGMSWIVILIVIVIGFWILRALFRGIFHMLGGGRQYGPGPGPGYGAPGAGYGGPGYGGGGGGGGFMSGMLGGLFGAAAGNWLYDSFGRGGGMGGGFGGGGGGRSYGGDSGPTTSDADQDYSGSGGDFGGGSQDDGGSGGDFGGGDSGGGDSGGGDFGGGGGDFGGGGGDFGGGGGDFGGGGGDF